jgi:mannose-6-phosphate isomerase-like protein (cupin superfamily)
VGKYDSYELAGKEREEALSRCRAQLAQWGLTMPAVTPMAFHFGLNAFEQWGLIEFWVANEVDAGYCGKYLFVFDGQMCPAHKHIKKHETFFVVKGTVKMIIDGTETTKREGDIVAMPPGVEHSFTGIGPALLLEASTPCLLQDNFFADRRIGDDGEI